MQWTIEQTALLYEMVINGSTNKQIANYFAVDTSEIRARRRKIKLTDKNAKEVRNQRLNNVMNLREAGGLV